MKNRPKKNYTNLYFFVLITISLYALFSSSEAAIKVNTPKAEALMFEELPNGQSKVVDSVTIEKETSRTNETGK
ncbi:hypothetical protein [Paenibacillus fonticola]|uniref:hypothetical protein n=1 Tax=Paenibacillus fonticola TaxID=379896 RepID=UPI0003658F01|nr:hypothetical protein [Paenibacillus fonticola]